MPVAIHGGYAALSVFRRYKGLMIECVILTAAGVVLARLTGSLSPADVFFALASVFMMWGIVRVLGNMHAFTMVTWSFKRLHRMTQGEKLPADKQKDAYLEYRESRPHHDDAVWLLVIAAVWTVLMFIALAV